MQCGLLGRKLGHSYSPQIHKQLANYSYQLFEKEPEQLEAFLEDTSINALNVTIPYKKDVIPFCDELSPRAKALGAVNTIVRKSDGRLIGHNSDYFGFQSMLQRTGLNVTGKKVVVLGSGGASATVVAVLKELGAKVIIVSRSGENNYTNLQLHSDASVIVNTTPVGMYPDVDHSPVDLNLFQCLEGVLDVIYNPARTALLQQAEQRKLITQNGLWMLVAQAKESAEWFTGEKIPDSNIEAIYNKLRLEMENLVLVGMPGCGKSTIGKLLAQKLNRQFIDADAEIERYSGKNIPQIFAESSEAGFREIETHILEKFGKQSGLVIATGGGCVTRSENYQHLHCNGRIIWVRRAIDSLPTDGRPLSQANQLNKMYQLRKPLYEQFSDMFIDNNGTIEQAVSEILLLLDLEV